MAKSPRSRPRATTAAADVVPVLRKQLVWLLAGGDAHMNFDAAVADWPPKLRGTQVPDVPHTAWRLVEHMRIAQWDIFEFCRNAQHKSPAWPAGYWPAGDAPPTEDAWDESLAAFHADLAALQALVSDPQSDLFTPLPHGDGQTLLREALLAADHNAYHLGQLAVVRRALRATAAG